MSTLHESGFSSLGAALDYDTRIEAARVWCAEHQREIDAGGLTINEAVDALLAGDLYRVDTGSAGYDMVVDAFNALDAIAIVADHAGIKKSAEELRTKFDPWSAELVKI